jgi:hypothetical protein
MRNSRHRNVTQQPRPDAAPRAARRASDRAAVITTAILAYVEGTLSRVLLDDDSEPRAAIEAMLRDEFADVVRTAINETCLDRGD